MIFCIITLHYSISLPLAQDVLEALTIFFGDFFANRPLALARLRPLVASDALSS